MGGEIGPDFFLCPDFGKSGVERGCLFFQNICVEGVGAVPEEGGESAFGGGIELSGQGIFERLKLVGERDEFERWIGFYREAEGTGGLRRARR